MKRTEVIEPLRQFLSQYFSHEFYQTAIEQIKHDNNENEKYQSRWNDITDLIKNRKLHEGEPLFLVYQGANQPLDEESDEEAWKWLDLVVYNINENTGDVKEY